MCNFFLLFICLVVIVRLLRKYFFLLGVFNCRLFNEMCLFMLLMDLLVKLVVRFSEILVFLYLFDRWRL